MELKYDDVFYHKNSWWWGRSVDIVKDDGTAIVCVKFDEKSFPKAGYICDLSVLESERKKGLGWQDDKICTNVMCRPPYDICPPAR